MCFLSFQSPRNKLLVTQHMGSMLSWKSCELWIVLKKLQLSENSCFARNKQISDFNRRKSSSCRVEVGSRTGSLCLKLFRLCVASLYSCRSCDPLINPGAFLGNSSSVPLESWRLGGDIPRTDAGTEEEFTYFTWYAGHRLNGNCFISHYIMEAKFRKGICFCKGKVLANRLLRQEYSQSSEGGISCSYEKKLAARQRI